MLTRRKSKLAKWAIKKWLRKSISNKASNDTCPITLTPINELDCTFDLIAVNMLRRRYCAKSLAAYFKDHSFPQLKDPESKGRIASPTLRRLQAVSGIKVYDKWHDLAKKSCHLVITDQLEKNTRKVIEILKKPEPCEPLKHVFFNSVTGSIHPIVLFLLCAFHINEIQFERVKNDIMLNVLTSPNEETRNKAPEWVVLINLFLLVAKAVSPRFGFTENRVILFFARSESMMTFPDTLGIVSNTCLRKCRDHIVMKFLIRLPMFRGNVSPTIVRNPDSSDSGEDDNASDDTYVQDEKTNLSSQEGEEEDEGTQDMSLNNETSSQNDVEIEDVESDNSVQAMDIDSQRSSR